MSFLRTLSFLHPSRRNAFTADRDNTLLIAGLPRSGTTLTCGILSGLPGVVALNEPMDVLGLAGLDPDRQLRTVRRFAGRCRKSLLVNGTAPSLRSEAGPASDIFRASASAGGRREFQMRRGEIRVTGLPDDFILAIKHNLAFAAILPLLATEFRCFGIIRNPLAVLASWRTISTPLADGRAPVAELLDQGLRASLDGIADVVDRQIFILNWLLGKFSSLPGDCIIRYEDIIQSNGLRLGRMIPSVEIKADLASRNTNPVYDKEHVVRVWSRLRQSDGLFSEFYSGDEIAGLFESLMRSTNAR